MEKRRQWGHLSEGHLTSVASAATVVPICIIKTVCRVQAWRWKGLRHSASFEKQGISSGFEILAKVLHSLCVLRHMSAHCGIASKPVMSKPRFAPLACLAGSTGHRSRKPLAGLTRSWLSARCPLASGTDPSNQHGWEQDRASTGRAVEQTNRLKAIS